MVRGMNPTQTANLNLCDYEARLFSRVVTPTQATAFMPTGTVLWKAELWNKSDDKMVGDGAWEATLQWAWADAEKMFGRLKDALEQKAEKEAELEMAS